ncbi:MAG: hypothetical protein WCP01_02025 [Methylococcaceae bacterium]
MITTTQGNSAQAPNTEPPALTPSQTKEAAQNLKLSRTKSDPLSRESDPSPASLRHPIYDKQKAHAQTEQSIKINTARRIPLSDIIKQQNQERGLEPLVLEPELLLKRISNGGHSGKFLADAFISAYRTSKPFLHSLGELNKLDSEAFRLFHEILHIRHIAGWSDDHLYQIEKQILMVRGMK